MSLLPLVGKMLLILFDVVSTQLSKYLDLLLRHINECEIVNVWQRSCPLTLHEAALALQGRPLYSDIVVLNFGNPYLRLIEGLAGSVEELVEEGLLRLLTIRCNLYRLKRTFVVIAQSTLGLESPSDLQLTLFKVKGKVGVFWVNVTLTDARHNRRLKPFVQNVVPVDVVEPGVLLDVGE